MSDSHRPERASALANFTRPERAIIGLIALCVIWTAASVVLLFTVYLAEPKSGDYKGASSHYCATYDDPKAGHVRRLKIKAAEGEESTNNHKPDPEKYPSEIKCRDLAAQESMAGSTVTLVTLAIPQFLLSVIGVGLIFGTYRQTATTTDAVLNEQRPWVKITNFSTGEKNPSIYDISLQNMGKSTAKNIEIRIHHVSRPDPETTYPERMEFLKSFGPLVRSFTILPNEVGTFTYDQQIHCSYDDHEWAVVSGEYYILITYDGVGCRGAESFGAWHIDENDAATEENDAREYS